MRTVRRLRPGPPHGGAAVTAKRFLILRPTGARRRGMPTHGSMTKAGKVRKATPRIEPKPKKNKPPRLRNKVEFVRRVLKAAAQKAAA